MYKGHMKSHLGGLTLEMVVECNFFLGNMSAIFNSFTLEMMLP